MSGARYYCVFNSFPVHKRANVFISCNEQMTPLHLIDLFCGAGGFGQGAQEAGVTTILAKDSWQKALDVHRKNHPNALHICMELGGSLERTCDIVLERIATCSGRVHIHASPPCQHFSSSNSKRNPTQGLELIRWTVALIRRLEGLGTTFSWSMEQVCHPTVSSLYKSLNVNFVKVDFSKYAVPQTRCRLWASNMVLNLPEKACHWHTKVVIPRGARFITGNSITPKRLLLRETGFLGWKRAVENAKMYTITSTLGHLFLDADMQIVGRLSLFDAMRLQTFDPFYFKLEKSLTRREMLKLIANSIPPAFAKIYMETLLQHYLRREEAQFECKKMQGKSNILEFTLEFYSERQ